LIRVNVSARERLDYSELEDVYVVGRFHHPPTSYLIRVNLSARERLDYSELEDVYLVLEEDGTEVHTANNFGIMYSRKRSSQNSFPNLIYIFPESFMIFCQELQDPKRNYENQV
jgi:hypothetical protein